MALESKVDTISGSSYTIELLASAIAANGAPALATAGISCNAIGFKDKIRVGIKSTAGSGTMTVSARLWQYSGGVWFVAKPLAADPSVPQTAGTIAETSADGIAWSEEVSGLAGAARIYLEIVAIAGTATAVTGYAIVG